MQDYFVTILYYDIYTHVHLVPYDLQDTRVVKFQITGVYILLGSAEIISDWLVVN